MPPKAVATKKDEAPLPVGKPVTFYSWIENQPSSLVMRVSGGERRMGADNQIIRKPMKEVRFHLGMYSTEDMETIDVLDQKISEGESITRNYEVFLSKTTKPEQFAKYVLNKNANQADEIESLKAQLAAAEAK